MESDNEIVLPVQCDVEIRTPSGNAVTEGTEKPKRGGNKRAGPHEWKYIEDSGYRRNKYRKSCRVLISKTPPSPASAGPAPSASDVGVFHDVFGSLPAPPAPCTEPCGGVSRAAMPSPAGGGPARPLFAVAEERDMVAWMTRCHRLGLVITREMFFEEVERIVQLEQRGAKSSGAVKQWISEFRKRHADKLGPNGLLHARLASERAARQCAERWYKSVSAVLAGRRGLDELSAFSDPRRVLYLGELSLQLDPRTASVAALQTVPPFAAPTTCADLTYVQALSASGERAPPMLVSPAGDLVRDDLTPSDACFRQTTATGRVTPTALIHYMVKSLEPHLTSCSVPRPVLIYVDGLRHHCSMTLTQFCDDEGIIMVGLPPAGQARSPLHQAVASLLAANFDRLVAEAKLGRRKRQDDPAGGMSLSLKHLLAGIRQACRRVCKETVAQAFTSSGLFPWGERVKAACQPEDGPAEAGDGPEPPVETPARSVETPARSVETPAKPAATPAKSADTPARSADTPARSMDTPARPMETSARSAATLARPVDTPARPPVATSVRRVARPADTPSGPPVANGHPRPRIAPPWLAETDTEVAVKREQESPPPTPPAAEWTPELLATPEEEPNGPGWDDPGVSDTEEPPDQLVLPQARLTEYLMALDAAGDALKDERCTEHVSAVMELKQKLHALHATSSSMSGDDPEPEPEPPAATAAPRGRPVCVVPGCGADSRRANLHAFPKNPATRAVWLQRCRVPPNTPASLLLACQQHFRGADLADGRQHLRPMALPSRKLHSNAAGRRMSAPKPEPPPPPSPPPRPTTEGRGSRGIKRPKRFDDFQCVDDAPLRPMEESAVSSPITATASSPDMTELANKPPAALKSIIGILRSENAQLRSQLEAERERGRRLADAVDRLVSDYRAAAPP